MKRLVPPLLAAVVMPACMTTQPPNISPHTDEDIHFEGFASRPNALIVLQGYNRESGDWEPIGGWTTASANKLTFGGRDLYQWEFDWNMQEGVPDPDYRECFWDDQCNAPFGGGLRLRAREHLGHADVLYTFRPGGLDCTIQRVVQDAESLEAAYYNCHPDGVHNDITISMIESEYPY